MDYSATLINQRRKTVICLKFLQSNICGTVLLNAFNLIAITSILSIQLNWDVNCSVVSCFQFVSVESRHFIYNLSFTKILSLYIISTPTVAQGLSNLSS